MSSDLELTTRNAIIERTNEIVSASSEKDIAKIADEISNEVVANSIQNDKFSYRAVVVILGFGLISVTVTYCYLAMIGGAEERNLPEALVSLGAAAIGALAGLLAPAPISRK
jgi:hypothetical protein